MIKVNNKFSIGETVYVVNRYNGLVMQCRVHSIRISVLGYLSEVQYVLCIDELPDHISVDGIDYKLVSKYPIYNEDEIFHGKLELKYALKKKPDNFEIT